MNEDGALRLDPDLIYKLVPEPLWKKIKDSAVIPPNADDERDGYIHLSSSDHVMGTVQKYYAADDLIICLGVDPAAFGDALKWEPARGSILFPHLYGSFPSEVIKRIYQLTRNASGYQLTELPS